MGNALLRISTQTLPSAPCNGHSFNCDETSVFSSISLVYAGMARLTLHNHRNARGDFSIVFLKERIDLKRSDELAIMEKGQLVGNEEVVRL